MTASGNHAPTTARTLRYAAEREQGEALVREGFESAWGWGGPAGRIRAARRASFLVQAAGLAPGLRCLEVGCGTGEFTTRLVDSGCELVAVELSEATAALCRDRVQGRAEVVVGNIETGEGIGGQFDAIVGVSVLHHVDVELFLQNTLLPFLRPGGRFAFSEPNMGNPQVWAERHIGPFGRWRHTTPHESAFRPTQLREILSRAGLHVEVSEPFEFLHPSTPAALLRPVMALENLVERTPLREVAGSVRVAGRRSL